jgi:hypothetical protein
MPMPIILLLVLYFCPAFIAYTRQSYDKSIIFALNLLLGWTVIGWFIALAWALASRDRRPERPPQKWLHWDL